MLGTVEAEVYSLHTAYTAICGELVRVVTGDDILYTVCPPYYMVVWHVAKCKGASESDSDMTASTSYDYVL